MGNLFRPFVVYLRQGEREREREREREEVGTKSGGKEKE
jgi:hypothetical protein